MGFGLSQTQHLQIFKENFLIKRKVLHDSIAKLSWEYLIAILKHSAGRLVYGKMDW